MPVEKHLPTNQFNNVIRAIKRQDVGRLNELKTAVDAAVARLGLKPNRRRAIGGTPEGSDQFETGSLITWMGNVHPEDTIATVQLVAIQATLDRRLE